MLDDPRHVRAAIVGQPTPLLGKIAEAVQDIGVGESDRRHTLLSSPFRRPDGLATAAVALLESGYEGGQVVRRVWPCGAVE